MSEEILKEKPCMFCGDMTHRRIYQNGKIETLKQWINRDWCHKSECVKKGRSYSIKKGGKKPGPKTDKLPQSRWKDTSTIHYFIGSL